METQKNDIKFVIFYEETFVKIETHRNEYRNLMMLIRDKLFPDYFGECGGQGRCGTCTIQFMDTNNQSNTFLRNEAATLQKTGLDVNGIRLSCQILIDEQLMQTRIRIIENY